MKRFWTVFVTVVMMLVLGACSLVEPGNGVATEPDVEAETYIEEIPTVEERDVVTIDVSDGITPDNRGEAENFYWEYDFDFDGVKEDIEIVTVHDNDDEWQGEFEVTIGNYTTRVDSVDGWIEKVYVCDIDPLDETMELAVITIEVSGDVRMRIYEYAPGLPQYKFKKYSEWDERYVTEDCNWLGYPVSYYFEVKDRNTIILEEQTSSYGMWSVYTTYTVESDGVFVHKEQDKYEILPDFMEDDGSYYIDHMDAEEYSMWQRGYIKAYENYTSGSMTIYEGEYFKPIYDDGDNRIFIEKENGEQGWISIDTESGMYRINQYYFYLAG